MLANLLMFAPGLDVIPPLGFDPLPSLQFDHPEGDDNHCMRGVPFANTCANCLHIPVLHDYELFKSLMWSLLLGSIRRRLCSLTTQRAMTTTACVEYLLRTLVQIVCTSRSCMTTNCLKAWCDPSSWDRSVAVFAVWPPRGRWQPLHAWSTFCEHLCKLFAHPGPAWLRTV